MVTERLIDTLCVALITGVTLLLQAGVFATFFKETGTDTRALTDVLTSAHFYIIIICVLAVCVLAFFLIRNVAVFAKVRGILHNVWVGILSLKDVKQMPLFIFYTVAIWVCYFLQFYVSFFCFDFSDNLSIMAALVMFVVGSIAVVVPTPNGAGPWHFAVITMMMLYGVGKEDAGIFALLVHGIQTFLLVYSLTQVPRPSGHLKKIQEFLLNFGKSIGVETFQDEAGNIIYRKPATPGMENRKKVILQSHMDMVAEKNNDTEHDFLKDPIQTYIDGEWVKARGTTLGADNGIGMAAAMAVMIDDSLVHGPVEALFTVNEEIGLEGAQNLGKDMITGTMLLNLDSEDDGEIFVGCAGGIDTTATFTYRRSYTPENFKYMRVSVTGLLGGHSGSDINLGRANANKVIARFIWECSQSWDITVCSFEGGNLRNAIPREANAVFGIHSDHKEAMMHHLNKYAAEIRNEYSGVEPSMDLRIEEYDRPEFCMDSETSIALIRAIYSAPHGVYSMSRDIEGLVETSTNLASVKLVGDDKVVVTTSQRSSVESRKNDMAGQVEAHFQLAGAEVTHSDGYPGWAPNMNSEIMKITAEAYDELFGKKPAIKAIHAGLECGLFLAKYPNLDMVSFGPTMTGVHSPDEKLYIPTVEKFWQHLCRVLEKVSAL